MSFYRVVYHHTESSFFNSDGAHYNIKLRIIDEVIVDSRISRWKKCHYCRGRRCQTRLTCCGKPCHYMCAANHNFVCGCTQKKGSQGLINLCESIQEGNDENYCSVCMDECDTVTDCGHRICRKCVDKLHSMHGNNISCPLCRKNLIIPKKSEYIYESFIIKGEYICVKVEILNE